MPCQRTAGKVPDHQSGWGGSFAQPLRFTPREIVQGSTQSAHTEDGKFTTQTGSWNVIGTEDAERLAVDRTNEICDS